MAGVKLFNTLTREKETLRPLKKGEVGLYCCGPTVYDHTHIGHMRTYVGNDILRRVLEFNGLAVCHVMNITDVGHLTGDRDMGEDKLEMAAKKKAKTAWEIAKEYEEEFFEVMGLLNVWRPKVVCRATEHIELMIEAVKRIEAAGFTYETSDGVYFETGKFSDYTHLSRMPIEKLKEGARVEVNLEKRNPTDFALWKFSPKDEKRQMEWLAPWPAATGGGTGFPGWHIECSAMSLKYLGEHFEIHTGGVDHIMVHHTNEIAQNQAICGHPVVGIWLHHEHLLVNKEKMSKSKGNFLTREDINAQGFEDLLCLRYLFLGAHYRKKLNFTFESLAAAKQGLARLRGLVLWLEKKGRPEQGEGFAEWRERFLEKINDDLNLPQAMAVVWEVLGAELPDSVKLGLVLEFDRILGLGLADLAEDKVDEEIYQLALERDGLRKKGDWVGADRLREKILGLGYEVLDGENGFELHKI